MDESQTQQSSTKKLTKGQIIGLVAFVVAAVAAIVAMIIIFVVNFNRVVPQQVLFIDNGTSQYFQTSTNDNYYGYRFRFVAEGQNPIYKDSNSAVLDVSEVDGLNAGTTYEVSVCYKGEVEGGNSDYSNSYIWNCYKYLQAPVAILSSNRVEWDAIENADTYIVYYSDNTVDKVVCNQPFVDFESLPTGERDLTIVASSSNSVYKQSAKSANIHVTVTHNARAFTSATITGNVLTVVSYDLVDIIEIRQGAKISQISNFQVQHVGDHYIFTRDISALGELGDNLSVRPASTDPYVHCDNEFITVTIS